MSLEGGTEGEGRGGEGGRLGEGGREEGREGYDLMCTYVHIIF